MDHNPFQIIAAARCLPNKPPASRSIPEKGHLGSFGNRSCMFLPVRFRITPAHDGSEELSLHMSAYRFKFSDFILSTHVPDFFWGRAQISILLHLPYRTVCIGYRLLICIAATERGIDRDVQTEHFERLQHRLPIPSGKSCIDPLETVATT